MKEANDTTVFRAQERGEEGSPLVPVVVAQAACIEKRQDEDEEGKNEHDRELTWEPIGDRPAPHCFQFQPAFTVPECPSFHNLYTMSPIVDQDDNISCTVVRAIVICLRRCRYHQHLSSDGSTVLFILLIILLILFRKNRFAAISAWLCRPWHNVDQRMSSQHIDLTHDASVYPMRGVPDASRLAYPPPVAYPIRMVEYYSTPIP